jgi:hypothetical protein
MRAFYDSLVPPILLRAMALLALVLISKLVKCGRFDHALVRECSPADTLPKETASHDDDGMLDEQA